MIYVSGPGHGGQALVGNTYLEGTHQATCASGRALNIRANKPVMTASEMANSSICNTNSGTGSHPPNHLPKARGQRR